LQTYLTGIVTAIHVFGAERFAMYLEGVLTVIRLVQGELDGLVQRF
jgi:hypothetical protein